MELIQILRKKYNFLDKKYEEIDNLKSSSSLECLKNDIEFLRKIINELTENIENILNINKNEFLDFYNKYNETILKDKFSSDFVTKIDDIIFVLEGKIYSGFPIELSEEQIIWLKRLIDNLRESEFVLNSKIKKIENIDEEELIEQMISYEDLIEKVQDASNNFPIYEDEFYLIKAIIDDPNFSFEEKKDFLIAVKKYNDIVPTQDKTISTIDINDFIQLLGEFKLGEEYIKVINKYKKEIVSFANIENVREILEYLVSEENDKKNILRRFPPTELISILLYSTKSSVKSTYEYLSKNDMLDVVFYNVASVWRFNDAKRIEKRRFKRIGGTSPENVGSLKRISTQISLEELMKCNDFLKSKGYTIDLDDEKSRRIFSISLNKLQRNYMQYVLYGLIDDKEQHKKKHSILVFSNIMEKCDTLIELGLYEYIVKYPSSVQNLLPGAVAYLFDLKNGNTLEDYERIIFTDNDRRCLKGQITTTQLNKSTKDELDFYLKNAGMYEVDIPRKNEMEDYLFRLDPMEIPDEVFEDSNIKLLEENFKKSEYVYDFNGQFISRYKVLRKYWALKSNPDFDQNDIFMMAIISNSMITKESYMFIAEQIGYNVQLRRD